jgi:hypothetical protein
MVKDLRHPVDARSHERILGRLLSALQRHRKPQPAATQPHAGRMIMRSPIAKLAVAAAIIAAVVLGLFEFVSTDTGSGVVWAEVAEKLGVSGGVTARMRSSHVQPGMLTPVVWEAKTYSSPHVGYRMESFRDGQLWMTSICNIAAEKMLTLVHSSEQYTLQNLSEENMAEIAQKQAGGMNPQGIVQRLLSGGYTELGRQTIEGVEVDGVEINDPPDYTTSSPVDSHVVQLWVSVETGYPVLMESTVVAKDGKVRMTQTVDQFAWNVELAPNLFQLNIPSDYTETQESQF